MGGGGGGGGWERRIEAFVKNPKKKFWGGGVGVGGRVRGGRVGGGKGGWERRSEACVKIQKKKYFFWGGGGVVDGNGELKLL